MTKYGAACGESGARDHRGRAAVGLFAHARVERQLAEQLDAVLLRHARAAAGAEQVLDMAAVAAHVHAHVLDDARAPAR